MVDRDGERQTVPMVEFGKGGGWYASIARVPLGLQPSGVQYAFRNAPKHICTALGHCVQQPSTRSILHQNYECALHTTKSMWFLAAITPSAHSMLVRARYHFYPSSLCASLTGELNMTSRQLHPKRVPSPHEHRSHDHIARNMICPLPG